MVNPNDPNSESGGVPSSEPSSDPSNTPSADSGPISDELFDSLSELLGDNPTDDEPASLPNLESWSEEPSESPSAPEELGSILGDTTMIQMGPDVDTPPLEDLSGIGDNFETADLTDMPLVSEDEGTQPLDAWSEIPSDPSLPDTAAAPTDSSDILSDPFAAPSGAPPVNLTPDVSEPSDPSLPDIAAASTGSADDILSDPFASPAVEPPVDLTPVVDDPSDPSLPDIAAASTSTGDTLSDPWAEPTSAEQPPITPLSSGIEEPTFIQPSDVPSISEPPDEPISLESTAEETLLPDPWTDNLESAAAEEQIPGISAPETTDFSGADSPVGAAPVPDMAADAPTSADIPAVEPEIAAGSTPADQPLTVGEDTSLPEGVPLPVGEDIPMAESPLPIDTEVPSDSDTALTASSAVSADTGEEATTDVGAEATDPVEPDSPAADIPAVIPPLGGVTSESAAVPETGGLEAIPDVNSDGEPEILSTPEPVPMPAPEPVAVGSASSTGSSTGTNAGDLGALSGKLPLDRVQAVGLLVAMSTLGTITYLGVTGDQQNPSLTAPSTPAVSSSPLNPNLSANNPAGDSPIASAPSASDNASSTGEADTPGQAPTNQTAAAPQSPTEAIGGLDAPDVIPSQLDISDVPEDHWAYPFITKLHSEGIIPDYPDGKFQPDKPVTRAELAAQIQRAFVNEPGQRNLTFSDIASDYWAADAIEGAVDKKFMSGYPEGDFQPDKLVPRYEVLVALVSGLELDIPTSPETSLQQFQDQGQLPDWSKGKIAASTQENIVVSHPEPGLLKPEANATRAEVAAMIYQALVQSGRLKPIESEYVVTPES